MIGHPISTEQAIAYNIAVAVALALEPVPDSNRIQTHLKDALRFAFGGARLAFFEGEHANWLAKTTDMALEFSAHLDRNGKLAAPLLAAFLEHRIFFIVDARFDQLAASARSQLRLGSYCLTEKRVSPYES